MDGVRLIDTATAWKAAWPILAEAGRLALDLEADGYHRYPERVSLVQLALPDGRSFIIDPLAVADLTFLGDLLAEPAVQKVFHSADYDLRSLDRDFGFRVRGLYDTAIAAQFCGSTHSGLANVLTEHLATTLAKPKRLQRLDWSSRPLAPEALEYAAGDVAHLLALADALAARLDRLGRTTWVAEECRRLEGIRFEPPAPPQEAYRSLPGARNLSGRSLAILRELYVFRDLEARRIGRPPHYVLPNRLLMELSANPNLKAENVKGIARRTLSQAGPRLEAALTRGRRANPVVLHKPSGHNPWTPATRKRLAALKEWRVREAEQLALDRGLVWPGVHLTHVALNPASDSEALDDGDPPWVRQWQWQTLGPELSRFRAEILGDAVPVATSTGNST